MHALPPLDIGFDAPAAGWTLGHRVSEPAPGLFLVDLSLSAEAPANPPRFHVRLQVPLRGAIWRWTSAGGLHSLPPNWSAPFRSNFAQQAPVVCYGDARDRALVVFAASEAMRDVEFRGGVNEQNGALDLSATFFTTPEAPLAGYEATIRIDLRALPFHRALPESFDWFSTFPEYACGPTPAAAFDPYDSSWYTFHKDALYAADVEEDCRLAAPLGMKGVIVDDGWQTEPGRTAAYAYCGDWQVSRARFPDMRAHVERVHALGMKYLLWYSVPFIGARSANFERFRGKYLYERARLDAFVLDPRFPEVREFLVGTYETALREWNLDGLKLDFIDSFHFEGPDPAVAEGYAGRDILSLPLAVHRLLTEIRDRLSAIRPDVLIEFRQSYMGPAVRAFASMIRAGDCPCSALDNRIRTVDLRLSSAPRAVHSDMLMWPDDATPAEVAAQLQGILFSVPQISVQLAKQPEPLRRTLAFWLGFWRAHRATLLGGELLPRRPDLGYPLVEARGDGETVVAVYDAGQAVRVEAGRTTYIANAGGEGRLPVDLPAVPARQSLHSATGDDLPLPALHAGWQEIDIPAGGLLEIAC